MPWSQNRTDANVCSHLAQCHSVTHNPWKSPSRINLYYKMPFFSTSRIFQNEKVLLPVWGSNAPLKPQCIIFPEKLDIVFISPHFAKFQLKIKVMQNACKHGWIQVVVVTHAKDDTLSNSSEDKAFEKCIFSSAVVCMQHHPFLLAPLLCRNASAKY